MLALRTTAAALALTIASPVFATTLFTGPAGQGQAFSQYQPSLALTQLVSTSGIFPSNDETQPGDIPAVHLGMLRSFAGNYEAFEAPKAQGQVIPIASNTALFSLYGTTYGGDGLTTYALPDLTGRTVIGVGQGQGLANFTLGQVAGAPTTALTLGNMPAHDHGLPGGGVTSTVGGNTPFDNYQPSLAMTYMIATDGVYIGDVPTTIGAIGLFGGNFVPRGWMAADGRLLNVDDYFSLFTIIGTTYGGDGQTTFALPDLRGRSIIGAGQGPGLSPVFLGETIGNPELTLLESQLAIHDHDLAGGGTTDPAGQGFPISNVQPSLGLNYIISLQGVFPSQISGDGEFPNDVPFLGEVIAYAGGINAIPDGWALAAGQLLSINQNQALFSILGNTHGGDGRVTFALPDLRGRVMVGTGQNFALGQSFGTEFPTLGEANLPVHVHSYEVEDAVPEPSTWAMMLGGFGLLGAALRRKRASIAA